MQLENVVEIRAGAFEELPVISASVDLVISNGVLNLAPDKPQVFREIARVLAPGGRLYLADVIVARELKLEVRSNPELWAACIGGALQAEELLELAASAGLQSPASGNASIASRTQAPKPRSVQTFTFRASTFLRASKRTIARTLRTDSRQAPKVLAMTSRLTLALIIDPSAEKLSLVG